MIKGLLGTIAVLVWLAVTASAAFGQTCQSPSQTANAIFDEHGVGPWKNLNPSAAKTFLSVLTPEEIAGLTGVMLWPRRTQQDVFVTVFVNGCAAHYTAISLEDAKTALAAAELL